MAEQSEMKIPAVGEIWRFKYMNLTVEVTETLISYAADGGVHGQVYYRIRGTNRICRRGLHQFLRKFV